MDPTNKSASNQAVQLLVLFIRFQKQLHVESYKYSIQSSKMFITEGKMYTTAMAFMDKNEMSTDWQSLGHVFSPSKQSAALGQAVRGTVFMHQ